MKTIVYSEVLNRALEASGRTRAKPNAQEAALLKSIFALELPRVWNLDVWNDLVPDLLAVTLNDTTKQFPNPYPTAMGTAIGEIVGIYSADPRTTPGWEELDFYELDGFVQVLPGKGAERREGCAVPGTVYVHYLPPCPDLLAVAAADLMATTLPLMFGNWLALRGAGHLLMADGAPQLAGIQFGLARESIEFELGRINRPNWAKF